ncbi:dedicator of cytokinesis protein 9/10/11 [Paragonimus westermani]|uniref:Dedicator of cytokinesis protein 9/10/11 n=1 Tax=Paragonimus westermani TaxID=34504 RepID=A0A5J4NC95_9TREM|nr:dedicator of cytokinesis protein 9/10/11 [Paragonimus westermani]
MDMTSMNWLENGKPLFTIQLDCLSAIYTHDPSLSRFFRACGELLDRVLLLPSHSTTPGSKSKANRVTFRDDLVEQVVTSSGNTSDQLRGSGRFRSENTACVLHLCNAIKSLLLIDHCALARFLPALFNQFMEIILIGAASGHRLSDMQSVTHDSSVVGTGGDTGLFWFDPVGKSHSGGTPNDLLKTAMGTMSMLISELNSSCPFNKDNWSMPKASEATQNRERVIGGSDNIRHPLLKAYVKYAFDATTLTTECLAIYSEKCSPEQQQPNNSSGRKLHGPLPIPLYHALVRSLVLLLADLNCARHILVHLVTNLWFPFALIVKSMTQYLCTSQKIKTDRHGESRFTTVFCDDLTLLVRLIGARVSSSSSASQPHATACRSSTGSGLDRRTGLSLSTVGHPTSSGGVALETVQLTSCRISLTSLPLNVADSNPSRQGATLVSSVCDFPSSDPCCQRHADTVAQHNTTITTPEYLIAQTSRSGSLGNAVNGLDVLAVTARFLCHLFNLMDRGYVMKRVRDLLIFLEIAPRMSVEEIDHLNELRFQLLNCLSQHEFFIQLNLPILVSNQGTADWVDTTLAVLHDFESRPTYELRLTERFLQEHFLIGTILSGVACLLAGCVDTGGWAVGNTPSHLYRQPLSLLRNLLAKHSLDPRYAGSRPCQARIAALYLPLVSLVLENPHVLGPPGESLKAAVIAAAARGELSEPSISDASSSISASDWIRNKRGTDTSSKQPGSSMPPSRPRSIVSDLSLETLAGGTSMRSASSSGSLSASNGSDGSISCKTEASSSTNHSSVAYLTQDDKVAPHILNRIAGVPIRRTQWRDRGSQVARSPRDLNAQLDRIELTNENGRAISSSHTGSTVTLTEAEEDPDGTETSILPNPISRNRLYSNKGEELDNIRMADDGAEQDWSNQVFALAGVLPSTQTPHPSVSCLGTEKLHSSTKDQLDTSRAHSLLSSSALKDSTTVMTTEPPTQMHQHRLPTGYLPAANLGPRRLTDKSQRELFICLLHILSTVTEEHVIALYRGFSVQERIYFLQMLNQSLRSLESVVLRFRFSYAIQHLRYRGKKCIQKYEHISRSGVGRGAAIHPHNHGVNKRFGSTNRYQCGLDELDGKQSTALGQSTDFKVLLEANLATEAGLIVLDLLQTFHNVFKQELESCKPIDPIFKGILDVYMALLVHNPSDHLIRHTFAALRMFVTRYSKVLFSASTDVLNAVCMVGLRCANECLSRSNPPVPGSGRTDEATTPSGITVSSHIRLEACGFLYKLWKSSFETFGTSGLHRVHLQTIIAVSKLVTEIGPGFDISMSILHNLVDADMRRSSTSGATDVTKFWTVPNNRDLFLDEVKDLIRRIRTVLTATVEMRLHNDDHERLVDLQYCLAKSYSSNPALRRTWLDELAELHKNSNSLAEFAMVKLHIAALIAEYLKRRGEFHLGCGAFSAISSNIHQEESGLSADAVLLELPYTQDHLLEAIDEAANALEKSRLYEAIRSIYDLVVPVYEARQDFVALSRVYHHIGLAYEKIGSREASEIRLFAAYFRVTFYGCLFESLAGKSFIYRANACQRLSGMCTELLNLYRSKYGTDNVELMMDYAFNRDTLDPNKAYIQVSWKLVPTCTVMFILGRHHDTTNLLCDTRNVFSILMLKAF